MLFKAKTGVVWWDLPERYGPWKTVYNRFWRWSRNGTLTALVGGVRVIAEAVDELTALSYKMTESLYSTLGGSDGTS